MRGVVESGRVAVAQNFIECDQEQELRLPPGLRDWPAG